MQSHRILAAVAATTTTLATLALCAAAAGFSMPAQAEPAFNAAGHRRVASDGQGNVNAIAGGGFSTAAGGQGLRTRSFGRSADGSVSAQNQASATTANGGSAQRSGSFTRNADGTASGERSTTVTNTNTGVSYDGSTTYTKGSGFSRNGSCKDAAGNAVTCGSAR